MTTVAVSHVPVGYHVVTPYLILNNATSAIEFYKNAFGAIERLRMDAPQGKVGHAELMIEETAIMLADECQEMSYAQSPQSLGGSSVGIHVYVHDVDTFVDRALQAGATLLSAPEDKFYGDRSASLRDPYGHIWFFSTHIEDVTPDEMKRRAAKLFG